MQRTIFHRGGVIKVGTMLVSLLAWPVAGVAQDVSGQARVIQATVFGTTTTLADTGSLSATDYAREASVLAGSISGLGGAEVLHATAVSPAVDSADAEASAGNLHLNLAGNNVGADFVMARAASAGPALSTIEGLTINGVPVAVSGAPNQTIPIGGGMVVLNEQKLSSSSVSVNAIHVVLYGLADVVIAHADAGTSAPVSALPLPGLPPLF